MSLRTSINADSQEHATIRTSLAFLAIFALAAAAVCATRASGQEAAAKYDSIAMHQALTDPVIRQVESTTKSYISTGNGNTRMVTAYFALYVPAKLTAPDGIKDLPAIVSDVDSYISRAGRSNRPDVTKKVITDAYGGLTKVAEGNYHPAGRIAAITLLSRLDQKSADNASKTPPVPLSVALPILMKLYGDDKNVDGVRAAALQGIHRHVLFGFPGIPPATRAQITKDMTALLDAEPPNFRSDKAHAYLQRYAVDILSSLSAANDPALGVKLIGISTKPDSPDLIALHSAFRIGEMGKNLQGKVAAPEKVLRSWSQRALVAFESEVLRLKAYERVTAVAGQPKAPEQFLNKDAKNTNQTRDMMGQGMDGSGMEGMMMDQMDMGDMGMMDDSMNYDGMMMGMQSMIPQAKPQPPEVSASRRKLNHVLQQLHVGVTGKGSAGVPSKNVGGLLASVPEDQKAVVTAWVTSMEAIVTALNDKMLDDRKKYLEGLETQVMALRELVGEPEPEVFGDEKPDVAADPISKPAGENLVGAN